MSNAQLGLIASTKMKRTLIVRIFLNKRNYLIAFALLASSLAVTLAGSDPAASAQGGFAGEVVEK